MKKKLIVVVAILAMCLTFALVGCSTQKPFDKVVKIDLASVSTVVLTNSGGASKTLTLDSDIKAVYDALCSVKIEKSTESDVAQNTVPYTVVISFDNQEGTVIIDVNKRIRSEGKVQNKIKNSWWKVADLDAISNALNAVFYGTLY